MATRKNPWGPNPALLTTGAPAQKAQYIVWMEFYGEGSPVEFEDVSVVTLTDFGQMWTGYVEVKKDDALYKIRHYRGTNVVGINAYTAVETDSRILTII